MHPEYSSIASPRAILPQHAFAVKCIVKNPFIAHSIIVVPFAIAVRSFIRSVDRTGGISQLPRPSRLSIKRRLHFLNDSRSEHNAS